MPLHGTVTGSHVLVSSDLNDHFALTVDNDQSTKGHGLKVTTDGSGTDTDAFLVEVGSTTHFLVRGDGRVGIGKDSSLPAAKVTIDGSSVGPHNADLSIAGKIMHLQDPDTHLTFPESNAVQLTGGGVSLFEGSVGGEGASVFILSGADGNGAAPDPGEFGDVSLFVSGAIGSRGGSGGGTAIFGGDMCISGTLHITGSADFGQTTTMIAHGGHPVTGQQAIYSDNNNGVTITAAQIIGHNGFIAVNRNSGKTDTLDTAANIIAAIPLNSPGLQVEFLYMNMSSNGTTVAGGTNVVMLNFDPTSPALASFSIGAGQGRKFILALHAPQANMITLIPTSDSFNLNS